MKLTVICLSVFIVYVNADNYKKDKGPRCYDCNYAPSGYVLSQSSGSKYLSRVGYQSCALRSAYDKKHVDKWGCKSGMCFIRKDYNGLVYRGCANKDNLPWDVNPSKNCQYQGPNKSLWYFCKGDLCNEGQLGESAELCGASVPSSGKTPGQQQGSARSKTGTDSDYNNRQFGKMGAAVEGYGIRESGPRPIRYNNNGRVYHEEYKPVVNKQFEDKRNIYQSPSLGVCDGDCYHNPSGLFPYADDKNYFVQCEADFYGNHPCTCCKATVLPCPYGTEYNDKLKVCADANTNQYISNPYDNNQDGHVIDQYKNDGNVRHSNVLQNKRPGKRDHYAN